MYFNEECLTTQEIVNKTNIKLPLFNRRQIKENTKKNAELEKIADDLSSQGDSIGLLCTCSQPDSRRRCL